MSIKYEILPDEKLVNLYIDDKLMSTYHIQTIHDKIERPVIITNSDVTGSDHMNLTIFVDATKYLPKQV